MAIVNVCLQAKDASFFLVAISNNVTEVNLTVFKAHSEKTIADYCRRDTLERFQRLINFVFIYATNQHTYRLTRNLLIFWLLEYAVDWVKHFFILQMHNLKLETYSRFRVSWSLLYLQGQNHDLPKLSSVIETLPFLLDQSRDESI